MSTFNYTRLWEDADGVSHFEDVSVELASGSTSPSLLSPTLPVSGMNFRRNTMDYDLDWHPAPRRQFIVNLTGGVKLTASDGEEREFGPGSVVLVEDVTGKGHKSQATGTEERLSLFIHLPDES